METQCKHACSLRTEACCICRDLRPHDPQGIYVIGLPDKPGAMPKTGHRFVNYCELCIQCYTNTHPPTPFFVLATEYEDIHDLPPSRVNRRRMAALRDRYLKKLQAFFGPPEPLVETERS